MSEKNEEAPETISLKAVYEVSIKARDFEISHLIQRNNFFMLFQGVLLASVMQAENSRPFVELVVCITGFLVSIYQIQMASGAKFWQEWWESRVEHFEVLLCGKLKTETHEPHQLFSVPPGKAKEIVAAKLSAGKTKFLTNPLILSSFSVGRAPIKVGIVLAFAWLVLLCATLNLTEIFSWFPNVITGFHVVAIPSD
ncbi:RipA family octameric membrane protein [Pseudomonas sp. XK-1]|uniref:RipA family octameric membrane protein n=1 Tax=Pseudomonas sp. XK-1 TaxID=3136019 RepID=UPI00311920C4